MLVKIVKCTWLSSYKYKTYRNKEYFFTASSVKDIFKIWLVAIFVVRLLYKKKPHIIIIIELNF